ncbi:hypothetical protein AgCh_000209 [Apium graveolens]
MVATTGALPFVVFHGMHESCLSEGVKNFTTSLSKWSGNRGHCIEIGNGKWDSWFMPLEKQVKTMSELRKGYSIVGFSQGNMVGRGVIEFCDGAPPFEQDIILIPRETALFGYYKDGSWSTILPAQKVTSVPESDNQSLYPRTKLYLEDWIGLRTLDEAGKVKFITLSGRHLEISSSDMKKYVLPYLKDNETTATLETTDTSRVQSSFLIWSSIKKAIGVSRKFFLDMEFY